MPVQISFFTTFFLLLSRCGTLRLASTGQHINSTNPELESHRGTALAGFEVVTICFRDCFKMPRELGGRGDCVGLRPAPAFLLFCCSVSLLFCFFASLLFRFSCFSACLLLCFSASLLFCFCFFLLFTKASGS